MKIAICTDTFYPQMNGVTRSIIESAKVFIEDGNEVMIYAPSGSVLPKELKSLVELRSFSGLPLPTYPEYEMCPPALLRVVDEIKDYNPDIIHSHTPFFIGVGGIAASKILKIPVVGTYHTHLSEFSEYFIVPVIRSLPIMKNMTDFYVARAYNRFNLIITPSNVIKQKLRDLGVWRPIRVIPNGIDTSKFESDKCRKNKGKGRDENTLRIVHFGRISYEKNVEEVVRCFKKVSEVLPDVEMFVVGSGPYLNSLKRIVSEMGIEENVHITGFVPDDVLIDIVCSSDIFITASKIETQGLVIVEAMAAGLPCIGPKALAIPEIIRDGFNGFVYESFDEMVKYTIKVLSDEELRTSLSRNALFTAKNYDVKKIAKELENAYKEVIEFYHKYKKFGK
ncbi:MAG: glycosyltransferase [Candidatus Asgardarchaeia archaeon]